MKILLATLAFLLAACASHDGRSLIPGQSTAAQVEAAMGRPAERLTSAAGDTVWFYPSAPQGRVTYAVRMRPDGLLIAVEQRLTKDSIARVLADKTTAKEVRELLGPPSFVTHYPARERDEWDYLVLVDNRMHDFLVEFSSDGIARKTSLLHDPIYDTPTPP